MDSLALLIDTAIKWLGYEHRYELLTAFCLIVVTIIAGGWKFYIYHKHSKSESDEKVENKSQTIKTGKIIKSTVTISQNRHD